MNCKCCHQTILDGQETLFKIHVFCYDEWNNRSKDSKCVVCGKNQTTVTRLECFECISTNADYSGYGDRNND